MTFFSSLRKGLEVRQRMMEGDQSKSFNVLFLNSLVDICFMLFYSCYALVFHWKFGGALLSCLVSSQVDECPVYVSRFQSVQLIISLRYELCMVLNFKVSKKQKRLFHKFLNLEFGRICHLFLFFSLTFVCKMRVRDNNFLAHLPQDQK